jgi:hypothetical protein
MTDPLHRCQLFHLGTVLLLGGGHMQSQQMTKRVDRGMHLGPLGSLVLIVPARTPTPAWTESCGIPG